MKYILGVQCNGTEFYWNVNCANENNCELLRELYYETIYPIQRPLTTTTNFINADIELCEKLILDGVSGTILCKYWFICNIINNGFEYGLFANFCNYGYYYRSPYSPPTTAIFNEIDIEIYKTNILECIFGVVCNIIGYNCNVNKMIIDMWYFSFF